MKYIQRLISALKTFFNKQIPRDVIPKAPNKEVWRLKSAMQNLTNLQQYCEDYLDEGYHFYTQASSMGVIRYVQGQLLQTACILEPLLNKTSFHPTVETANYGSITPLFAYRMAKDEIGAIIANVHYEDSLSDYELIGLVYNLYERFYRISSIINQVLECNNAQYTFAKGYVPEMFQNPRLRHFYRLLAA